MINVYLAAVPSLYEGEDIEIRYSIVQEDRVIEKEVEYLDYFKPAVVGLISVMAVLRRVERYKTEEIVIYINDASLYEVLKETSTTKNEAVIRQYQKTKRALTKFKNLTFIDISQHKEFLPTWKEMTAI